MQSTLNKTNNKNIIKIVSSKKKEEEEEINVSILPREENKAIIFCAPCQMKWMPFIAVVQLWMRNFRRSLSWSLFFFRLIWPTIKYATKSRDKHASKNAIMTIRLWITNKWLRYWSSEITIVVENYLLGIELKPLLVFVLIRLLI